MKRKLRVVVCATLVACVPGVTTPTPIATPFDPATVAYALGDGPAVITGQAFAKTRGGDTKFASGETVTLLPVSDYTTEYMKGVGTTRGAATPDPRLDQYTRKTVADGEGKFTFSKVPKGNYFVFTKVYWEVPGQYGLSTTGSWLKDVVTVREDSTRVILQP